MQEVIGLHFDTNVGFWNFTPDLVRHRKWLMSSKRLWNHDTHLGSWNYTPNPVRHMKWLGAICEVMELCARPCETQEVVGLHFDTHLRSWNSTSDPVRHRK